MYLKRQKIKKFWPVPRKGTKYLAIASHNQNDSIPLLIVMRDILKLVKNKKELKKVINEKKIQINNKEIRDTNYPISLFDIVSLPNLNKNYRASFSENKKMIFEEVSEKDAEIKIIKVIGKKTLSKNKIQLNLMGGKNIFIKDKVDTGDSIVLNLKDNKVIKIIKLEKGKTAFVIKGGHMGKKGKISEIFEQGGKKIAQIDLKEGKINVWSKNIILIE